MTRLTRIGMLAACCAVAVLCGPARAQFENTDFEAATVPDVQNGMTVPASDGLPSWSVWIGDSPQANVLHNNATLGGAAVSILGPYGWSASVIDGSYSALLIGGAISVGPSGTVTASASISQVGQVPADSTVIRLKVRAEGAAGFGVTLDAADIPLHVAATGANYTLYEGDVASFAGSTVTVMVTAAAPAGSGVNYVYVDDLEFARTPTPLAPVDIAITSRAVAENMPGSTKVGSFSTLDPNVGDTFTYLLEPGVGGADNASFAISGSNLLTATSFNYEVRSNYSIRVRSADQGGLSTQAVFAIRVVDVDETPVFSGPPEVTDGRALLRWGSVTNHAYTIHGSTNLLEGYTVLQSNIPAAPAVNVYTDSVPAGSQRYWKITTVP